MRSEAEIEAMCNRIDATLTAYRQKRKRHPVTGDYAFDLTMPELDAFSELLGWVRGKVDEMPYFEELLKSAGVRIKR